MRQLSVMESRRTDSTLLYAPPAGGHNFTLAGQGDRGRWTLGSGYDAA